VGFQISVNEEGNDRRMEGTDEGTLRTGLAEGKKATGLFRNHEKKSPLITFRGEQS